MLAIEADHPIRPGALILCLAATFWLWPLVLIASIARLRGGDVE